MAWVIYRSRLVRFLKRLHLMHEYLNTITLFEWVFTEVAPGELPDRLRFHELRHVQQYRWHLYLLFIPAYLLLLPFFGYLNHPYERDARRYAERKLGNAQGS